MPWASEVVDELAPVAVPRKVAHGLSLRCWWSRYPSNIIPCLIMSDCRSIPRRAIAIFRSSSSYVLFDEFHF